VPGLLNKPGLSVRFSAAWQANGGLMEEQDSKNGKSPLRLIMQGGAFVAGWFVTQLSYRRMMRQEVAQLRSEMSEQLRRLSELEKALSRMTGKTADIAERVKPAAAAPAEIGDEVTPERMAVIAAVVTAFLGRKVKIHHARLVNPEVVSPWAQQGRVFVQASHALARH
jgi:hypothetical protein